jgi:hypothetical protein
LQKTYAIITIFVIAGVHFWAVPFFRSFPKQTQWISDFSAGLGLGYAFLYLLPKIGGMTSTLQQRVPETSDLLAQRLYFYMLLGFLIYYLIEFSGRTNTANRLGLMLNGVAFSTYNCLIAITIVHLIHGYSAIYVIVAIVFSLHLFGVNNFLFKQYPRPMSTWMRWAFAGALAFGCIIGEVYEKNNHYYSVATALVGGIIIILSFRIKLPSRSLIDAKAFLMGVSTATAVIVLLGTLNEL